MSKGIKKIASVALPIIGTAVGASFGMPQLGAVLGGAAGGATTGKGLKGIGIGAATGFAGNAIGNALAPSISGALGKTGATALGRLGAGNIAGPLAGSSLSLPSNAFTNALANTTVSGALSKVAGNSIADSLGSSLMGGEEESAPTQSGPAPFVPGRDAQLELPSSLSSFGSLAPDQQSSSLATEGVYGGGLGQQEQDYFTNMLNRRLVDDTGQVDADLSEVSPIENSYLSQIGLGGYGDARSLLEALSKRKQYATA